MLPFTPRSARAVGAAAFVLLASVLASPSVAQDAKPAAAAALDASRLSPVVSNPYVALSTLTRAVYVGKERDPDTGRSFKVRMEISVRDSAESVAGIKVRVVDVTHYADDEVVEKDRDFYAQDDAGVVYYLGQMVDDYEDGKIVGHDGQWMLGQSGSQAGVFMPAVPAVGAVFEQQRAPGIAQSRSKVLATARTVKVPAGTFKDCIETEYYDPVEKVTERKWYCAGVGLVKQTGPERTIELTERVAR